MRFFAASLVTAMLVASSASALNLNQLDKDENDLISEEEFLDFFSPDLDKSSFRFLDKNNDGNLDLREFLRGMMVQGPLEN